MADQTTDTNKTELHNSVYNIVFNGCTIKPPP